MSSIKLTGGDPALYEPLEEVVRRLRDEAGFMEIELISRHPVIGERARGLAEAGVTLFNLSVDTLDPGLHHELCGVDDLPQVLGALDRCLQTGVPAKVNMVVMGGVNDDEVPALADYCATAGVATLKLLDVIGDLDQGSESFARRLAVKRGRRLADLYFPFETLTTMFARSATTVDIRAQGGLGHPMTAFTLPSGLQVVLKDGRAGAWRGSICRGCRFFPCHDALMALRMTADLRLQFCLLREDITVSLAGLIGNERALQAAVADALAVYGTAVFTGPDAPQQGQVVGP